MKKILTIALTIFKPTINEIENYLYSFREINKLYFKKDNPFQFLILSDNPDLDSKIEQKIIDFSKLTYNADYLPTKKNKKRLGIIFDNLEYVKGTFLKVVDPDDFIVPKKAKKFVEKVLRNMPNNSLILNSYCTTKNNIHYKNFVDLKLKSFFWTTSFNPNSTYPTKIFKKINWEFELLVWSDDLIGYLLVNEGARIKYKVGHKFYINKRNAGVSITKETHNSLNYYLDTMKISSFFSKEVERNIKNKRKIKLVSGKPNRWMVIQVTNDLKLNTSLSNEQKEIYFNDFISKIKIINKKWYLVNRRFLRKKKLNLL